MCDSGEELVGDFDEIEEDTTMITETSTDAKMTTRRKSADVKDSPKIEIKSADVKDSPKIGTKSVSTVTKRKSAEPANLTSPTSSKVKRLESEKKSDDRNIFSTVQEHENMSDIVDDKKNFVGESDGVVQEVPKDELLALDSRFADDVFERISAKLQIKAFGGYRTIVRVSPVVFSDMTDSAMQRLIKAQRPNICFCFKGQAGTFRKKKGYIEIHVEKDKDWYTLLHHLCQVKFAEKKVTVKVSIMKVSDNQLHAQGSFVLRLSSKEKIAKLLQAVKEEDSRPINKKCFLSLPEVPLDIPIFNLRHFFPFLPTTSMDDCAPIKSKPGFKGPVRVCYRDLAQVEAISDCFSEFTVNGQTLSIRRCNQKEGEDIVWSEAEGSAEEEVQADIAIDDTVMEEGGMDRETDIDTKMKEEVKKEVKEEVNEEDVEEEDDISSMARDLCSDMRESLNKLKQMETDDPNIQKILEFQDQLAQLQKTLTKPGKKSEEAKKSEDDPWTLNPSDIQKPDKDTLREKSPVKVEPGARAKKSQQDPESGFVASVQEEMKALKEQEEKRRANWAKKMIEDVKQNKGSKKTDSAAKIDAQKLLQAREERLRLKKEEEEAAERQRKAEELERQKKAEEEEEKKRQEKNLKEGIAQIVLPFQDVITTGTDSEAQSTSKSQESKREPEEKTHMIWETIYLEKVKYGQLSDLPPNFKVQLRFYENRGCPVTGCPNKRYFKKREEFASHWQIFHQENLTVKFCPKCSAYFGNTAEIEDHLRSRHLLGRSDVKSLLRNLRQKVIRNPSYRDPGLYMLSK